MAHKNCGSCGTDIEGTSVKPSIAIRNQDGDLVFESIAKGTYCEDCAEKLIDAIIGSMPVPDRKDPKAHDTDAMLKIEKALIESQAS
jgi:hypothetical protein